MNGPSTWQKYDGNNDSREKRGRSEPTVPQCLLDYVNFKLQLPRQEYSKTYLTFCTSQYNTKHLN